MWWEDLTSFILGKSSCIRIIRFRKLALRDRMVGKRRRQSSLWFFVSPHWRQPCISGSLLSECLAVMFVGVCRQVCSFLDWVPPKYIFCWTSFALLLRHHFLPAFVGICSNPCLLRAPFPFSVPVLSCSAIPSFSRCLFIIRDIIMSHCNRGDLSGRRNGFLLQFFTGDTGHFLRWWPTISLYLGREGS